MQRQGPERDEKDSQEDLQGADVVQVLRQRQKERTVKEQLKKLSDRDPCPALQQRICRHVEDVGAEGQNKGRRLPCHTLGHGVPGKDHHDEDHAEVEHSDPHANAQVLAKENKATDQPQKDDGEGFGRDRHRRTPWRSITNGEIISSAAILAKDWLTIRELDWPGYVMLSCNSRPPGWSPLAARFVPYFSVGRRGKIVKILHLLSLADAQSIPLELALALKAKNPQVHIAAFSDGTGHPTDHHPGDVVSLGARGAFDVPAVIRLRRLIAGLEPHILHVHHGVSALWAAAMALSVRPRPVLVKTEHNDHRFAPWHHHAINLCLFPVARAIVCNSDATLASFSTAERVAAGGRTLRIYNGLNLGQIRSCCVVPRPQRTATWIGTVGRLVPQKNHRRLILGFAEARARTNRDLRLEIVGDGPLRQALQVVAEEAGVADAVSFSGGLTRSQVYQKLGTWDGFVMASEFEGFCNAHLEAMAAGLPVAVSDIETLREVAGPGATRFDPYDPKAIGTALTDIADQKRQQHPIVERYDLANTVAQHEALYRALLDGKEPLMCQTAEHDVVPAVGER